MRKLLSAALFFVVVGVVIAQTPEPKSPPRCPFISIRVNSCNSWRLYWPRIP